VDVPDLATDQKVGGSSPSERARSEAPCQIRKGPFCCSWEPRWEPRARISRRTAPGSSTQPPPACHLQGGAAARHRVRRSPRRALALGRPRPARPRRTSLNEVSYLDPSRPICVGAAVFLALDCPAPSRRVQSAYGVAARSAFRRHWTRRLLARDSAPARRTGKIDHTCDVGADGAVSTPAVDRDLVAEASRTVGRADEIGLRRRGRPFLLRLPESADGGNP
jgi:hypothetical protein